MVGYGSPVVLPERKKGNQETHDANMNERSGHPSPCLLTMRHGRRYLDDALDGGHYYQKGGK